MQVTTRGRYGIIALLELAKQNREGPVALREVAEARGLSEPYLEQLIGALRKAGLVESVRGAHGGYMLGREPDEISVGDILKVLEGGVSPSECANLENPQTDYCELGPNCVLQGVWREVTEQILRVVDNVSLSDLVEREREQQEPYMYYI